MKVWSLLDHRKRNNNHGGLCFSTDSPHYRFGCSLARRLGLRAGGGTGLPVEAGFISGDIFTIDMEEGQYDAALLGQITHYFTPEQNIALFKRVHASLVPTGVLVIDAPMTLDKSDEWGSFGSFFIWATSAGKAYSFTEYRSWLEVARFTGVRQLGIEWLSARKS